MQWGRRHLVQLASLLLPQQCNATNPSSSSSSSSRSSSSSSRGGDEDVLGYRWLRGALHAIETATETSFLLKGDATDMQEELLIA